MIFRLVLKHCFDALNQTRALKLICMAIWVLKGAKSPTSIKNGVCYDLEFPNDWKLSLDSPKEQWIRKNKCLKYIG